MKLATLVYVQRNGQTLMLHRVKKENDMHQGKWNGLGGKLELGESPEECAVREVREESGLIARNPRLRGILTFPAFAKNEDWYVYVFTIHDFVGELHPPDESLEGNLAWIDNHVLLDLNLWPGDRVFLPWLNQPHFFSGKFIYDDGQFVSHDVVFHAADRPLPQPPLGSVQDGPAGGTTDGATDGTTDGAPDATYVAYTAEDDTYCWTCGGPVTKRHCKIVCQVCGFMRDCSDP